MGRATGGRRARRLWAALACATSIGLLGPPAGHAAFGDASILAPFPADPGFPEGIAVHDGRVYAAGAATLGTTGAGPSAVVVYDRATGAQVARHDTQGEDLLAEHANSSIAFDAAGRLHVVNTQLGVYRLLPASGEQQPYAEPFPDLRPCAPPIVQPPCSPTPHDAPPIPNDIAFAPDGAAYVSDSTQATIWRVPPGGGAPAVWFQDARLASAYIGVNGLRVDPEGERVVVTVSADLLGRASIYSVALEPSPSAGDLSLVHRFGAGELPDGLAFGEDGDLHVAMASPQRPGIAVVRGNGTLKTRLTNPPLTPIAPYDGPANIAFDGAGRALLTNHAPVTGLALRRFSIVDTDLEDAGAPLFLPG